MALLPAVRPPASRPVAPSGVAESADPDRPVVPTTPAIQGRLVLVAAGLLLTGVLVAALLVGGGRPSGPAAGLPDAGALTGWGRPAVDLLVRVLAVLTVGQLAYAALLAPLGSAAPTPGALRALRGTTWAAAGWLLAEAVALVLTTSAVYGVPLTGVSWQAVTQLTELPLGRASLWVALLLALVVAGGALLSGGAGGALRAPRAHRARRGALVLLVAALGAVLVPVLLTGHSAAAADHVAAVLALSVHVVAASLWVGGLTGLLLHGRRPSEAVLATRRFSALALACVALLAVSGVGTALLVAGPPSSSWWGQGWVWLLLTKTLMLGLLVAMGWGHRRRTLPALEAGRPRSFLRLGMAEVALMAAAVAVSVGMAASPAPSPAPVQDSEPVSVAGAGSGAAPSGSGALVDDMSGHDHGDLSVSVLIDAERFHVGAPVRPSQPVTVYNSSDSHATITASDGSFHADIPPRTFLTFAAPATVGDPPFVSRVDGRDVAGFADVLRVREDG